MTETIRTTARRFNGKCPACKTAFGVDAVVVTRTIETQTHTPSGALGWPRRTSTSVIAYGGAFERFEGDLWIRHACGRNVRMNGVSGTKTETTCGARCLSSHGPSCECACGGANHGRGLPGLS